MNRVIFTFLITFTSTIFAQEIQTPLQKNNYSKPASYEELTGYVQQLDMNSGLLNVEVIGKSVQGRNLYAMKFSSDEFGKDPLKIKVLFLAQQHGNEQSGKEAALILAWELLKPENQYLFDRIDLAIVPQMNPDGSEENKRRNGNETDLNRNHLILTEPETIALHHFFDHYLFEVTMDIHEYSQYNETWKEYGYRDNSDELLGTTTNLNVSKKIRDLSDRSFLPFMKKYFNDRHITNFIYCPGGPPEIDYIRHSTFDINDGRQSFGILNSFSFIQEGMNGEDSFIANMQHRAESQMTGMRGLLEYVYWNKEKIKTMIAGEREKLIRGVPGKEISIQSRHVRNGTKLELPVHSYFSNNDSIITVIDFRPVVESIYNVKKPSGYLIPKQLKEVVEWTDRQEFIKTEYIINTSDKIVSYEILAIDSIDFEGDTIVNPIIVAKNNQSEITAGDYLYVPTSQLKGNLIVIALEPKSMLGLVTYDKFVSMLKAGETFPILRVDKKSK